METTRGLFQVDKWSLVHWKVMDISKSFIWIFILFDEPIEYGDGGTIKLVRFMK
jgi:hypothetical protein